MSEEFQEFGPKLLRSTIKVLLCERVEQFCLRLIVEPIFAGTRHSASVKIVVGQVQMAGGFLVKQVPVALQARVEAGFEHAFRLGRRRPELQHSKRTYLGQNPDQKGEKSLAKSGRLICLSPVLLVTRA